MKKKLISLLVLTLMLGNTYVAKAASNDDKIKVSLTNIKEIMLDNSLDMKSYYNTLQIAKNSYEDAQTAVDDAESAKSNAEDALNNAADEDKDAAQAKLDAAEKTLDSAETDLTNKKYAYKTAKINYEKNVESAVYSAQQQYISYLSTLSSKNLAEDTVKSKEKASQLAQIQYDNGFISKQAYITSTEDDTDAVNQAEKLEADEALTKTKLCNTLGVKNNSNVVFNDDINEDFQKIAQINFDDDLNEMLDNNFAIKVDKINIDKLDEADSDSSDDDDDENYTMDNAKISLKQQIQNAKTDFKGQYNTLISSYNSIKASYDKINEKQNEFNSTQIKYDYGFISQKDLDDAKLTLDTEISNFQASRNTFYLNYLHYIQMKEGY